MIKALAGRNRIRRTDVYPAPRKKTDALTWQYLRKLSGKSYHPDTVKQILIHSGFEILHEDMEKIQVAHLSANPMLSCPARYRGRDHVIDRYDNVASLISDNPSVETPAFFCTKRKQPIARRERVQ